jgi:hypothetical protein
VKSTFLKPLPAIHCNLAQQPPFFYDKKGASMVALFCQEKLAVLFTRISIAIWARTVVFKRSFD